MCEFKRNIIINAVRKARRKRFLTQGKYENQDTPVIYILVIGKFQYRSQKDVCTYIKSICFRREMLWQNCIPGSNDLQSQRGNRSRGFTRSSASATYCSSSVWATFSDSLQWSVVIVQRSKCMKYESCETQKLT